MTVKNLPKKHPSLKVEVLIIRKFAGIFVSILTPFNEKNEIDYETIKSQIEFLIGKGVHGIVTCGVNGEFSSLTLNERKKVIKTTVNAVKGRVPVIAGAYSNSYKEAIDLVNYAEQCGATAALIMRPFFFRKPTDEGVFNYFYNILEQVNKFPIFLCNLPIYKPLELKIEIIENLLQKYNNIVGIKDLSNQTEIILKYAGMFEELSVFVGSDRAIYNGLNAGTDGAISALGNIFPEFPLRIYNTYQAGNTDKAWIEQESLIGIRAVLQKFPLRAAQKFLLSKITGRESFVRPPLRNLTTEERENLLIILNEFGLQFQEEITV